MRMVRIYFHTSIFISQWDRDRTLTLLVLSYVPYERVPVTTVYWEARGKNKDS